MELYVGSVGYENSDAYATAVGTTAEAVEAALEETEREMLIDYRNGTCDETCGEDQCEHLERFETWNTGAMAEGALWTMRNVLGWRPQSPFGRLPAFTFDDLRAGNVGWARS